MALETKLRRLAQHIATYLETDKATILDVDGDAAFAVAKFGEPRVINQWPFCSVQPIRMVRELKGTRKFELTFEIEVVIYHGQLADHLTIQAKAQKRIEAVDDWFAADFKWNFDDTDDSAKDKVMFGFPVEIDHPVVIAPEDELWAASRLRLQAISEETF